MTEHAWDEEPVASHDLRRHTFCRKTSELVALGTPSLPGMTRQQELATGFALYIRGGISSSVGGEASQKVLWTWTWGSFCLCRTEYRVEVSMEQKEREPPFVGRSPQETVRGSLDTISAHSEDHSLSG